MSDQYYLAEKGCSRGLQERLLLSVDKDKNVRFHRGYNDDKFGIDDDRLICLTENGGLPYLIYGPLTKEELKSVIDSDAGWSGRKVRHAVRIR